MKEEVLDDFNTATGVAFLSSSNQSLDGTTLKVSIQCASTLSTHSKGITPIVLVTIRLLDKCRTSTFNMPLIYPTYKLKYLWEVTF